MHKETIAQLLGAENAIRALVDANHEEIKAAQSAAQAAASLAEGLAKREKQAVLGAALPQALLSASEQHKVADSPSESATGQE